MTTLAWAALPAELDRRRVDAVARQAGLDPVPGPTADVVVAVATSAAADLTWDPLHRRRTDERYRLDATSPQAVTATVTGERSLRWALVDLARRADAERWEPDAGPVGPAFAVRGIIEGFYGPPWPRDARLDMVAFAARNRFTTLLHAPKDDPYLRRDWRTPHGGEERDRLAELAACCHDHGITLMVGISPGLSMSYASAEDRELLHAKALALVELGVGHVALLLDDIPDQLQHPADVAAFGDLAAAHAATANALHDALRPTGVPLAVCPTQYWGAGDEAHISRLGDELDPRVDLLWTGRAICSPAITAAEAATFARATHRPPLYWDNYPVNDLAMRWELHVGPYRNRDPLLDRFAVGVLANAMEHPEASKIALATIGDYLWDPAGYDPDASWEAAIARVAGPADAAAVALVADALRASCLSEPDPVVLTAELQRWSFAVAQGDGDQAAQRLLAVAEAMRRAADHLLADDGGNPRLRRELRPWVEVYADGADAVAALATHASHPPLTDQARAVLSAAAARLADHRHRVFGEVVQMALDDVLQ